MIFSNLLDSDNPSNVYTVDILLKQYNESLFSIIGMSFNSFIFNEHIDLFVVQYILNLSTANDVKLRVEFVGNKIEHLHPLKSETIIFRCLPSTHKSLILPLFDMYNVNTLSYGYKLEQLQLLLLGYTNVSTPVPLMLLFNRRFSVEFGIFSIQINKL